MFQSGLASNDALATLFCAWCKDATALRCRTEHPVVNRSIPY